MEKLKLGFAMTGSFCTWAKVMPILERLTQTYEVFPIFSPISYCSNNRFGKAEEWIEQARQASGHPVWHTIEEVEPIGPKNLLDAMVVAPCTGNTIGKLANGITDTCVTMACKASLRNGNPLILAVSTNDALGASARNIGQLMNAKNLYFVPMSQDDPLKKPTSLVAHFELLEDTLSQALKGQQLQPMFQ